MEYVEVEGAAPRGVQASSKAAEKPRPGKKRTKRSSRASGLTDCDSATRRPLTAFTAPPRFYQGPRNGRGRGVKAIVGARNWCSMTVKLRGKQGPCTGPHRARIYVLVQDREMLIAILVGPHLIHRLNACDTERSVARSVWPKLPQARGEEARITAGRASGTAFFGGWDEFLSPFCFLGRRRTSPLGHAS